MSYVANQSDPSVSIREIVGPNNIDIWLEIHDLERFNELIQDIKRHKTVAFMKRGATRTVSINVVLIDSFNNRRLDNDRL